MTKLKSALIASVMAVFMTSTANAGVAIPSVTGGFVGLNWTFGASPTPEVVIGLVRRDVTFGPSGNTAQGVKAALYFDAFNGFGLDKFKVTGFSGPFNDFGQNGIQGEFGAGYDFQKSTMFGTIGANTDYFAGGVDIFAGSALEPFVMVHSFSDF